VRRDKILDILAGALIALALLVPFGAVAFIKSGLFNVGASKPHTTLTQWITHETMIHSVRRHASRIKAPSAVTARQIMAGYCTYETHCVACHGSAGVARKRWANGFEPQPPYLLDGTSNWTPAQLFWIAKNGIKMTAMPSWRDSLGDPQIWEVVGYLEAARRLPPQSYLQWRREGRCG
jgi:mono/diheme cytochrome c family protein